MAANVKMMTSEVDPNRKLIDQALAFVRAHAGAGDEEAINILHDYTVQSAVFDFDDLPRTVVSQIAFRDEQSPRIARFVEEVRTFYRFTYGDVYDEFHLGHGKSEKFQQLITDIRNACDRITVPLVDTEEVQRFLNDRGDGAMVFEDDKEVMSRARSGT